MTADTTADRRGRWILADNWPLVALRGLAAILFGVLAIVWPSLTLLILVWLFGLYAAIDGVFNMVSGIRGRSGRRDWMLVLLGAVGVLAGVIAIAWPSITAFVLLIVIAAWAVVTGIVEIAAASRRQREGRARWSLVVAGIASIVFGALLVLFPSAGALALVLVIAAFAIVYGGVLLVAAYQLRSMLERQMTAATETG